MWALYLDEAPVLAHAAVALLSIAGSEAAVERSFSAQGSTHSDRRNRLQDEIVEAEMFVKFNRVALQRAAGEQQGSSDKVQEMTDKYDDTSDAPSVADLFKRIGLPEQDEKQPQQPQQQQEQQQGSELDGLPAEPVVVRSVARPPPPTDDVQRFVEEYVRTHTITARFRWQPHHEQQLQAAAVGFNPPMRDVVSVLKKVMVYVRGWRNRMRQVRMPVLSVDIEQHEQVASQVESIRPTRLSQVDITAPWVEATDQERKQAQQAAQGERG